MTGKFIVLEGIDRSGKEHQSIQLVKKLASIGISAKRYHFPRYVCTFGDMIGQWLRKEREFPIECVQLLHTLDKQEAKPEMEKLLKAGTWIVCDRYYLSQLVYGLYEMNGEIDWLAYMGKHLLIPDLLILLDITVKESMQRGEKAGEASDRNEKDKAKLKAVSRYYYDVVNTGILDGRGIYAWHEAVLLNGMHGSKVVEAAIWEKVRTFYKL